MRLKLSGIIAVLLCLSFLSSAQTDYINQWPQFRGAYAGGIIDGANLPASWDVETGENIKWKIEIPGLGHSSPIVWNDKIFVTTAISGSGKDSLKVGLYGNIDEDPDDSEHEFKLYCINKISGQVIWDRTLYKGVPGTKRHTKSSHANSTPATNGEYIVAFLGTDGLFCYDFQGNLKWKKDFGKMNAGPYTDPDVEWGFASSPIIHENKVIIQCDFIGESFLASIDLESGEEIWRAGRDEISTWSSPNFYNKDNYRHIIVNGYKHMGAYDFDTGKEVWKISGGGDAPVPTPIFAHGLIYIHNSHGRAQPIYAVKPDAKGDISLKGDSFSNEYIVWSIKRGAAYMPTNLIYGNYIYNMRMNGVLYCFDAKKGTLIYKEKVPDARGITASAVASDGKLYYSTELGNVYTVKTGSEFELLAKNKIGDVIMATPAITKNMLIFRTQHYLIAVGK